MEQFVLLSHEETLALLVKAKTGDKQAKERLVECNYPLIKSIVARFKNKGVEYDDLYQLGCVGFLKAIDNFDPKFEVRFSTYAVPMIAGEIKRFLRDDGNIKVSRALKSLSGKINRFIEDYKKLNEHEPTIGEIAKEFDCLEQDVVFALEALRAPISLSDKDEEKDKSMALIDKLAIDDGGQEKLLMNVAIKEAIASLDERDRKIVMMRYFFGKTQSEIARVLGVSQVQVSRLENKVLEKLRGKLS